MNDDHIMDYLIERYNSAMNQPSKDKLLLMINQLRDTLAVERIAKSLEVIAKCMLLE